MKTKKIKIYSLIIAFVLAGSLFISCEDGDDCEYCTTKILNKGVWLKNTDTTKPESTDLTSIVIYKYGDDYTVMQRIDGCFSSNYMTYYVCNPSKLKNYTFKEGSLRANIYCNIRDEVEGVFHDTDCRKKCMIEILKVQPIE
ncbi:MAG: hypothetical protein IJ180_09675 [Bacteroidales bacterium]|nr:hypothetical protein [Bacteroidales bacterium]